MQGKLSKKGTDNRNEKGNSNNLSSQGFTQTKLIDSPFEPEIIIILH